MTRMRMTHRELLTSRGCCRLSNVISANRKFQSSYQVHKSDVSRSPFYGGMVGEGGDDWEEKKIYLAAIAIDSIDRK